MQQKKNIQIRKWLYTTSLILHERPENLQKVVLQISRKNPEVGSYASHLAILRMSGLVMEDILVRIWNADSAAHVDQHLNRQVLAKLPSTPALFFLAELIKTDLAREKRRHPTVH